MNDSFINFVSGKGSLFAKIGAGLVILSFFLPWVSGWGLSANGWQIANQLGFGFHFGTFLILLLGIAALVLAFMGGNQSSESPINTYVLIGIGVLGLIFLFANNMLSVGGKSIGYFGVIIGFLLVIAGGVVNLRKI